MRAENGKKSLQLQVPNSWQPRNLMLHENSHANLTTGKQRQPESRDLRLLQLKTPHSPRALQPLQPLLPLGAPQKRSALHRV